eukprot:Sspe_Gene.108537::Locus_87677_Transcript_1_1_Confidence_1.000_Length_1034::g.108537::m.108537
MSSPTSRAIKYPGRASGGLPTNEGGSSGSPAPDSMEAEGDERDRLLKQLARTERAQEQSLREIERLKERVASLERPPHHVAAKMNEPPPSPPLRSPAHPPPPPPPAVVGTNKAPKLGACTAIWCTTIFIVVIALQVFQCASLEMMHGEGVLELDGKVWVQADCRAGLFEYECTLNATRGPASGWSGKVGDGMCDDYNDRVRGAQVTAVLVIMVVVMQLPVHLTMEIRPQCTVPRPVMVLCVLSWCAVLFSLISWALFLASFRTRYCGQLLSDSWTLGTGFAASIVNFVLLLYPAFLYTFNGLRLRLL